MKKEKSNKEAVIKELSEHIDAIFSPLIRKLKSLLKEEEKKVEEPLPCPFCGSECEVENDDVLGFNDYRVRCKKGHKLDYCSDTKEEAIKKWNERV